MLLRGGRLGDGCLAVVVWESDNCLGVVVWGDGCCLGVVIWETDFAKGRSFGEMDVG